MEAAPSRWRRNFSAYPGGRPGLGLLLLRLAAAADLAWWGYVCLAPGPSPALSPSLLLVTAAALALLCAAALAAGYQTAPAAVLAGAISVGTLLAWLPVSAAAPGAARASAGFALVIALALACLGPGALSIDARRYGHREIVIPRPPSEDE